ncbi:carbohydrate-binding module family 21 protein [Atractiella rhizophila]|nr:carbohydrate-binding module family 21 protein [Atractiella rhizophila]
MPYLSPSTTVLETTDELAKAPVTRYLLLRPDSEPLTYSQSSPKQAVALVSASAPPIKSSLRSSPLASSLPSKPSDSSMMCCRVHFNPNPEEIKVFQYTDEPTVIRSTAVTEQKEQEWIEYPSQPCEEDYECSTDDEEDEKWLISRHLVNFPPFPSSKALNSEMYLEKIDLCSPTAFDDDPPTCLRGRVAVQNLAFRKSVLVRWTVDGWKSHSEVLATSLRTTRGRAFEEFEFEIGLDEMTRNTTLKGCGKWWEKRLQFCVRFRCGNLEIWDDNEGQYYEVLLLRSQGRAKELQRQNAIKNRRRHHIRRTKSHGIPVADLASTYTSTSDAARGPIPQLPADLRMPPTPRPPCRPLPPIPPQTDLTLPPFEDPVPLGSSGLASQLASFTGALVRRNSTRQPTSPTIEENNGLHQTRSVPPLPEPYDGNSFELTPGLTAACLKGGEKGFVDCSTCELKGCEGFQW